MNPVTLQRLAANGSDLISSHSIVNVFHMFAEGGVESLCRDLEASGFKFEDRVKQLVHAGIVYWQVEAKVDMVPVLTAVDSMTDLCVGIAARHEADYDGWYTEVVSKEAAQ